MPDTVQLVTVRRVEARDRWATQMRQRWRSPLLRDVALVGGVVGLVLLALATKPAVIGHSLGAGDVAGAIIAVALVVLGRRALFAALTIAAVATAVTVAVTGNQAVVFVAVVILLYKVASKTDRRTTGIAWGATIAFVFGVSLPFVGGVNLDRDFDVVAWSVIAITVGDAVRNRRAFLAAVEERARRAEESREEEARRQVAEERLRIARELHDLVAHRMAVINVQAGVAAHLLRAQPDEAEQALRITRASASEVLGELGEMLSVLRNADDPEAPVEPTPTLHDLAALIESFTTSGLEVSWTSSGTIDGLTDLVQLTLFRVAQEGLTNAQRYGDGRASLRVERDGPVIHLTIENRIAEDARAANGFGYGLLGIRERVPAVGGTLELGPTGDGRFKVAVHVPVSGRRTG